MVKKYIFKKYTILLGAQLLALSAYAPLFAMRQEDQVAPGVVPACQQSKQIAGQEEKEGQKKKLTTEERLQRIEHQLNVGRWVWMVSAFNGENEQLSESLSIIERLKICEADIDDGGNLPPRPPMKRLERLEEELGIRDL